MPNPRCEQAKGDFDGALYEKNLEVDPKIGNAIKKRNVALAGLMAAGPITVAALFSDSDLVLAGGLVFGGFGAWLAYRKYQEALLELAEARARCEQLIMAARDALQRVCNYCRPPDYDPEECSRRRAELNAEKCG